MQSEGSALKNGKQWLGSPSRQCSSTPVSFGQKFLSKQCDDIAESSPTGS